MSGVATAVGVGGLALGATAGAMSADNSDVSVPGRKFRGALTYTDLSSDREVAEWAKEMYAYGDTDVWKTSDGSDARTTPYTSAYDAGTGYYVEKKTGRVISEDVYNRESKEGRKEKFNKKSDYEWVVLENTANEENSQQEYERKQLEYANALAPGMFEYSESALAAAQELLPSQTEAAQAQLDYTTQVTPEQALADIAAAQYTQQAVPEKWNLVTAMSELAKRSTEDEAASQAAAEVAQAYNTEEKTLLDDIRRTGAIAGSGRAAGLQADLELDRTKALAGAKTAARTSALGEQYEKLAQAVQLI